MKEEFEGSQHKELFKTFKLQNRIIKDSGLMVFEGRLIIADRQLFEKWMQS